MGSEVGLGGVDLDDARVDGASDVWDVVAAAHQARGSHQQHQGFSAILIAPSLRGAGGGLEEPENGLEDQRVEPFAEPHHVRSQHGAAGTLGRAMPVRIRNRSGETLQPATSGAARFHQVAVKLHQLSAAGPLVQVVDVL